MRAQVHFPGARGAPPVDFLGREVALIANQSRGRVQALKFYFGFGLQFLNEVASPMQSALKTPKTGQHGPSVGMVGPHLPVLPRVPDRVHHLPQGKTAPR